MNNKFTLTLKAKEFSKIKIPTKNLIWYYLRKFFGVFQTWQTKVLDKPKAWDNGEFTYQVKIISISYYFFWIKIFIRKVK